MHSNQARSPADALLNFLFKTALSVFISLNRTKEFETNFKIQLLRLALNARLPDSRYFTLQDRKKPTQAET